MSGPDCIKRLATLLACWIATASLGAPAHAIIYVVNSTLDQLDVAPGDGICSTADNTCTLRAAVMEANRASATAVTITLPVGTFLLTRSMTGSNDEQNGDLDFIPSDSGVVTLQGAGAEATTIDAHYIDRVIHVAGLRTVIINALTLRNGAPLSVGGGVMVEEFGALEINDCVVANNTSGYAPLFTVGIGGGGWISGSLKVRRSKIRENQALYDGAGGGLYVTGTGTLSIAQSTISQNTARVGGGLQLSPGSTATIAQTAIIDNSSVTGGGGLRTFGSLVLINSTISGNSAGDAGGGIFAGDSSTSNIYGTTIAFNRSDENFDNVGNGGGVSVAPGSVNTFNIRNTLMAGNSTGFLGIKDDCTGIVRTYGQNRFGSANGCMITPVTGTWGLLNGVGTLGPLQNNGGPTQTIALMPSSNAIDAATSGCVDQNSTILPTDQRGFPRYVGLCDIGAFEYGSLDPNDVIFENGFE